MNFTSVSDMLLNYINRNLLLGGLFVLSVVWIICRAFRRHKTLGLAALASALFPFLTVFNPLIFDFLTAYTGDNASFYRFLWAFPLVALGACFLTEIVTAIYSALSGRSAQNSNAPDIGSASISKKRNLIRTLLSSAAALILCAAIMFSGTSYLTRKNLAPPENKFAISRATLDISQFIRTDPDYDGEAVILAPTEIIMELQAYDITIRSALPRTEYLSYGSGDSAYRPLLTVVLEGAQRNNDYMNWNLYSLKVDYIAALTNFYLDDYMKELGYPVYNRTGDYTLYKRTEP